jgi:hypothetical protein
MWTVVFTEDSLKILDTYIEEYQDYFLNRYSDTGIWSEYTIRENYKKEAQSLYDAIYLHTLNSMKRDIIGHESSINNMRTTATFLGKRIIFVEYRENQENMTRYIHHLKIIYR